MKQKELYEAICLPKEMIEGLEKAATVMEEKLSVLEPILAKVMKRETMEEGNEELKKALGEDEGNFKLLYCHLECACRIYDAYVEKGISKEIFLDTMGCFTRFAKECSVRNKKMYFDRGFWTVRQVSMSLFRIGTLEYEFCKMHGKDVISVHIPSDADLSVETLDESFRKAKEFFKTYFPEEPADLYVCDSWLLAPSLKELLPENSKILGFQRRFDIQEVDEKNLDCLEWLFKVQENTPYADLPEETSLQRKAKERLLSGGHIGAAYGEVIES